MFFADILIMNNLFYWARFFKIFSNEHYKQKETIKRKKKVAIKSRFCRCYILK